MWINITKDIFDHSDFKGLNYLYQILTHNSSNSTKPRYNIVIDTEKVKDTENFKRLSSIEKSITEFLDLEYSYYSTYSHNISYKITSKKAETNFNIEEAILFFNQPVSIILENNKNDAEFVLAIVKHWGTKEGFNKAQEHINNAWLQFENAGGCGNIPNFLEGFLQQFKSIAQKNSRSLFTYFRGFIIIDSDKEFENQSVKKDHQKLLKKIEALGFDISNIIDEQTGTILNDNKNVHILKKRMMENYIPKQVFQEIFRQINKQDNKELYDWLNAYLNLNSDEQLNFLNIPAGTLYGRETPIPDELNSLWCNLGGNFQKLDTGFNFKGFDDFGKHNTSRDFNVKNELPKWFKKEVVTKENLTGRDSEGELQTILDKIFNLL